MSGWALVRARARIADTVVAAAATALAAAGLVPMFVDLSWLVPALVTVVVIGVLGAAARGLGLPVPLVPIVETLGLLVALTVMFAGDAAWGGFVPTTPAWDLLQQQLGQGLADAGVYAAPVEALPGLVLLAVGGVGLAAMTVDTMFVSVRAPLLAGIPLLALYLVPAVIRPGGTPWWTFAAAAVGWLLVLAADQRERVRAWADASAGTRIRGLSAAGRRIGLLAVLAATLVAVLLPARAANPWATGEGDDVGTGVADGTVILDPLVSMRRNLLQSNDTTVLTYRTQADPPSYLRVSVLEEFDGTTWRPREGLTSGRDIGVPLPGNVLNALVAASDTNRVTGGESLAYDISVSNLGNAFLPLPYPITEVTDIAELGDDWQLDPNTGMAFSADVAATGRSYRVAALDPRIDKDQLAGASAPTGDLWPLLSLPTGLSPTIDELATEVTAEAKTPYDKALALQDWFTRDGGFTYSTSVASRSDADYIAQFLSERVGYCEQFAGAMAIMARTLGIPSRVVVGFTQGAQDADGAWRVTVRDAHAWPELWFDGVGWVRFEPTPRSGGTVLTPAYAVSTNGQVPDAADDDARRRLNTDRLEEGLSRTAIAGESSTPLFVALGLALVLLLASAPMLLRLLHRRRRLHARSYADVVEGAWAEVGALAVDLGQPWSVTSTPRQAAARLGRGMGEAAAHALRRLRAEVERVRYAPPSTRSADEHADAVRADVRVVMRELRSRVRWQVRLAAYCWPSSERRRQRSSMRSMNPDDFDGPGAGGAPAASAASTTSAGRAVKAE